MKLKSDHFLYAAGACLGSGLALILFGECSLLNNQPGTTLTVGIIVLLIGLALYWLSDAVYAEEERRKIRRNHARNPEYPENQERGACAPKQKGLPVRQHGQAQG